MFDENILKQACKSVDDLRVQRLIDEADKQPDHTFSKNYEKCKKRIISDHYKYVIEKAKFNKRRTTSKVVKIILVAAVIMALLVSTVLAYAPFRKFILSELSYGTEIIFNSTEGKDYLDEKYTYIPDGYTLKDVFDDDILHTLTYSDDKGNEIFITSTLNDGGTVFINTENADCQSVNINGYDGFYVEQDNALILTWATEKYNHTIKADFNENSNVDKNAMVNIAKSREKN